MRTLTCGIYARVSTKKQETELQLTDLRKHVERMGWRATEYVVKAFSVKQRPVFERMLKDAQAGRIDVVLVWRIDRFARSMRDFVNITLQLKTWNVRLISATENVDSGDENPFAKFMVGLLALLAELERNIIVERVKALRGRSQAAGQALRPTNGYLGPQPGTAATPTGSELAPDRRRTGDTAILHSLALDGVQKVSR